MKANDLKAMIAALTQDIEFAFNGQAGSIIPISHQDIGLSFGEKEETFNSIDAAMSAPFFNGASLSQIAETIELL